MSLYSFGRAFVYICQKGLGLATALEIVSSFPKYHAVNAARANCLLHRVLHQVVLPTSLKTCKSSAHTPYTLIRLNMQVLELELLLHPYAFAHTVWPIWNATALPYPSKHQVRPSHFIQDINSSEIHIPFPRVSSYKHRAPFHPCSTFHGAS